MNIIFTIVEFLVLCGAIVLEYLYTKRMGVARYLVYKEKVFSEGIFSLSLMKRYKYIIIALLIISIIFLMYNIFKKKNRRNIRVTIPSIIVDLIGLIFIIMKDSLNLKAYYFFIIAIFIIIIIESIKLIVTYLRGSKLFY